MFSPISVSLSGPAFSFLLYENTKCRFQQEGLLLGEIIRKEVKTITDNDQQQINISKTIKVNSVMPFPQIHYFYNGTGKIDEERIRIFLGNQFEKVVAWYRYQKIPTAKFYFRDKIIHRQLSKLFGITPEMFCCCILSNEVSENASTHLFSQTFIRCNSLECDKLPIKIPNLSEPNNMYKSSEPSSETFNKILEDLKIDKKNTQGLVIISKIQSALQKHVETLVKDLSESEKYLLELEKEVKQLEIYQKVKKKNDDNLDSLVDIMQSSSNEHGNNKKSSFIETPLLGENFPETNKRTPAKRQSSGVKKKNEGNLIFSLDLIQSRSPNTFNEQENMTKYPGSIDTSSSENSSPEKITNKKQASGMRNRREKNLVVHGNEF